MTTTTTARLIPVELCHKAGEGHPTVVSFEQLSPSEAKARLATSMANHHYYRVQPADTTGAVDGDDERYAADMAAIAVE